MTHTTGKSGRQNADGSPNAGRTLDCPLLELLFGISNFDKNRLTGKAHLYGFLQNIIIIIIVCTDYV